MRDLMTVLLNEGNLENHAQFEMDRVGLFDEDADYDGMLGDAVMELIRVFAGQGHSGFSAGVTRDLFHRLSNWETLSSITNDPAEWMDVAEYGGRNSSALWQCKRNPALFSTDGGKTYYHVDRPEDIMTAEQGVAA